MHGRRIYHARGKVLGGSSSINGMIFQRGNPLDYERWAASPDWDYAHCLPYFKRMETLPCRRRRLPRRRRAAEARARAGDVAALRRVLRGRAAGRLRADRPTSTAGGRRASRSSTATIYRGRRLSAARAYLHPVLDRPNLEVRCRTLVERVVFEGTRAVGVAGRRRDDPRERGDPLRRRDQLAAAAAALRRRQRARARGARRRRRARPAGRRREPPGPPRGVRAVRVHAAGVGAAGAEEVEAAVHRRAVALPPQRPGRDEPLRGGRVRALERRRRLSEPHVPLPAARDPLRRHVAGRRSTATRCTSGRCTPTRAAR